MPLRVRRPRGALVAKAVLAATVVALSAVDAAAQSSRETDDTRSRISRLPCRLVAGSSVRKAIDKAWDRSETVRRQCEELAAARAVVTVEWGASDSQSHASTGMAVRDGVVVATVRIPPLGETIVLLAHELQHVIEKTRGVDFEAEARRPGSGVWRAFRRYETQAAIDVSRRVAQELRKKP